MNWINLPIWSEFGKIKSEKSDLKKFGLTVGLTLLVLNSYLFFSRGFFVIYLFAISAALIFFGLTFSQILKPFQKIWMSLAVILGWFSTRTILFLVFFLIIIPISFALKLIGKDPLNKDFNRKTKSHWIIKAKTNSTMYEKQF